MTTLPATWNLSEFALVIGTGNAAFEDGETTELARLLRAVADRIENGSQHGPIRDGNGNTVGEYRLT